MALRIYILCVLAVTVKTQNTVVSSVVSDNGTVSSPTGSLDSNRHENNSSRSDKKVKSETTTSSSPPPTDCPELSEVEGRKTVVLCKCKANEILTDSGQCLPYEGDMYIEEERASQTISTYEVITKAINCDEQSHQPVSLSKGQFYFRPYKGDIIIRQPAHELDGHTIHTFCIDYQEDSVGNLTWTLKGCVPHPAIPRCCPFGQAMSDGSCQPKKTPLHLTPPISTETDGESVNWTKLTYFSSPLKCDNDPVKTYPVFTSGGHLISHASGLLHFWRTPEFIVSTQYRRCREFCIDGITNSDGTVNYFVSFCYSDAEERHQQACGDGPCVRKCCHDKQAVIPGGKIPLCRFSSTNTFDITAVTNLTDVKQVQGLPLCDPETLQNVSGKIHIDEGGYLIDQGSKYSPKEYCIDSLMINESYVIGGYVCPQRTTWEKSRDVIFPVGYGISVIFLVMSIFCYMSETRIMRNGGSHQLHHAIFLAIAYLANFVIVVFSDRFPLSSSACLWLAITMQFGYLGAFFWLNVICFELWRMTRGLNTLMVGHKRIANWRFVVYGFGSPAFICFVTVMIQFYADDDIPGLIKPDIGLNRCWFKGDLSILIYFYGTISVLFLFNLIFFVLTFIEHRQLMQKYDANMEYLNKKVDGVNNIGSYQGNRKKTPKHILDHVPEFTQKMRIFILCATLWTTEILSWKIPPLELWALSDIINTLQGLILFIILLGNRNKRKLLKKKFPKIYKMAVNLTAVVVGVKARLCPSEKTPEPNAESAAISMSTISMDEASLSTSMERLENIDIDGTDPTVEDDDTKNGTYPTVQDDDTKNGNYPTVQDEDTKNGTYPG